MKRKYQESYNCQDLFKSFRNSGHSIDSVKYQIYGSNNFIPEDFPKSIPDIVEILDRLNKKPIQVSRDIRVLSIDT